ncbi:hypothetical protein UlMin_009845 [Ulmus minor]
MAPPKEQEPLDPFIASTTPEVLHHHINYTHNDNPSYDSFVASNEYYVVVESVLNHSTQIVDEVLNYNRASENKVETPLPNRIDEPVCMLKKIGCQLSTCNVLCEPKSVDQSTIAILKEVASTKDWETKAVLTLAAFAMEFGDFCCLIANHLHPFTASPHVDLTKSLALLKRTNLFTEPLKMNARKQATIELNNLIKDTLKMMESIFEIEKLAKYDAELITDRMKEVDVYWIISAVVVCAAKLTSLTSTTEYCTNEQEQGIFKKYAEKIGIFNNKELKDLLEKGRKKEADDKKYRELKRLNNPREIVKFLTLLLFDEKETDHHLFDGSTSVEVEVELLKEKNLLFLISRPNIEEDIISHLKLVHDEKIIKNDQYKIVWLPIVDDDKGETVDNQKASFQSWKSKMPWLSSKLVSDKGSIRFLREDWGFVGRTILLVRNAKATVEKRDALPMIQIWGAAAFPFHDAEVRMSAEFNWMIHALKGQSKIQQWAEHDDVFFIYGGKDKEWVKKFEIKVDEIFKIKDPTKAPRYNVNSPEGDVEKFWKTIAESFLFVLLHSNKPEIDAFKRKELQKLITYIGEEGWCVLMKGSKTVITCHGLTALRILNDFDTWKVNLQENSFEICFERYYEMVTRYDLTKYCSSFSILDPQTDVPNEVKCVECYGVMEKHITFTFKCCHSNLKDNKVNKDNKVTEDTKVTKDNKGNNDNKVTEDTKVTKDNKVNKDTNVTKDINLV